MRKYCVLIYLKLFSFLGFRQILGHPVTTGVFIGRSVIPVQGPVLLTLSDNPAPAPRHPWHAPVSAVTIPSPPPKLESPSPHRTPHRPPRPLRKAGSKARGHSLGTRPPAADHDYEMLWKWKVSLSGVKPSARVSVRKKWHVATWPWSPKFQWLSQKRRTCWDTFPGGRVETKSGI